MRKKGTGVGGAVTGRGVGSTGGPVKTKNGTGVGSSWARTDRALLIRRAMLNA